jgi:hypothetical protein
MILDKAKKKVLWKILLEKTTFENHQYGKIWMLSSGAANMMSMAHNQNYYF